MVIKNSFGTCKCGKEIFLYTIENNNGCRASVINYGAVLVNLWIPDRRGELRDIVLGFDRLEDYYGNDNFFGSTVGPNANRIGGAVFSLDGKTYHLDANDGNNNLHSHKQNGYHKRYWEAAIGDNCVAFFLEDDNTLGFPGKKAVQVTYTLNDANQLKITYHAESDRDTLLNLTNHSYFNLEGHRTGNIESHILELSASHFTPVAKGGIPTGEIRSVEGTPFDFRTPKTIGQHIDADSSQLKRTGGYDHNWVLDGQDGTVRRFACVKAPASGIRMNVYTDLPGVQFYAGNFIDRQTGKENCIYSKRQGFCLETQYFPDSPNRPEFPCAVFGPDRSYDSTTIYEFAAVQ